MKLVFVYNADSGKLNTLLDIVHKVVRPETYECALCAITHGILSETKQWRDFRQNSGLEMDFLHRDEFERDYHTSYPYPVVLKEEGDELSVLLTADELSALADIEALIGAVKTKTF